MNAKKFGMQCTNDSIIATTIEEKTLTKYKI